MKYFILLILLSATVYIFPQGRKIMSEHEKKLEEIRLKYIPDKRTEPFIYDIKEENGKVRIFVESISIPLNKEIEQAFPGEKYEVKTGLLPSDELAGKVYGIINLSVANARTQPGDGAEMATQGLLGHPVKVYKKHRGYYLVQTADKYVSWIDDDGIQLMNEKEFNEWSAAPKIIYTKDYGLAYSQKDINSPPVSDLVKGNILKKINSDYGYFEVEFPDKRKAFIPVSDAADFNTWADSQVPDQNIVLATASHCMGFPYLWGGTSVKGMDCSGFTKVAFLSNGIILPRDASQQVNSGDPIDISDGFDKLIPGDLLFFGSRATDSTKERVTHVAIYIGNNEFIHSSGRVRINSLDKSKDNFSAYRFNSLLKAKRILGAKNTEGILKAKYLFNIN